MDNREFQLNQDNYGLVITGLVAAFTGTTDTGVLSWANAPAVFSASTNVPLAEWVTFTQTAAAGGTFKILRRGLYLVRLLVAQPASSVIWTGISLDASGASLTANPNSAALPFFADSRLSTLPAATTKGTNCEALIPIPQRTAEDPLTGFIRGHATNGSGAVPGAASITIANVSMIIQRVADLNVQS